MRRSTEGTAEGVIIAVGSSDQVVDRALDAEGVGRPEDGSWAPRGSRAALEAFVEMRRMRLRRSCQPMPSGSFAALRSMNSPPMPAVMRMRSAWTNAPTKEGSSFEASTIRTPTILPPGVQPVVAMSTKRTRMSPTAAAPAARRSPRELLATSVMIAPMTSPTRMSMTTARRRAPGDADGVGAGSARR